MGREGATGRGRTAIISAHSDPENLPSMCKSLRDRYDSTSCFCCCLFGWPFCLSEHFSKSHTLRIRTSTCYTENLYFFKNDKIKPSREANDMTDACICQGFGTSILSNFQNQRGMGAFLLSSALTLSSLHIEELIGKRNESWSSEKNSQWRGGESAK